jgi:ribosomal protein S18 acetylase RimI-like enzyme
VAERDEGVLLLSQQDLEIYEPRNLSEREELYPVLETSFEGWYLSHSKRTLREIEKVFAARIGEVSVGVVMLKTIDPTIGYVYYIAVAAEYRGRKIGSALLEYSLDYFSNLGMNTVFASLTVEHGGESKILFESHGFVETNFGQVSKRYGRLHAINMYRKMLVVTGELVVYKELNKRLD